MFTMQVLHLTFKIIDNSEMQWTFKGFPKKTFFDAPHEPTPARLRVKIGKNNFHKIKNHPKFVFCVAYQHKAGSILHLSVLRQFFCRLIRDTIIFGAKKIFLLTFPLLCYHCCIFCCRFNFGSDVEKLPHCFKWTADEAGKFSCWQLHAPFFADTIKLIDFERNVRSACANLTGFSGFLIWADQLERLKSYCYENRCKQHHKMILKTRKSAFLSSSEYVWMVTDGVTAK